MHDDGRRLIVHTFGMRASPVPGDLVPFLDVRHSDQQPSFNSWGYLLNEARPQSKTGCVTDDAMNENRTLVRTPYKRRTYITSRYLEMPLQLGCSQRASGLVQTDAKMMLHYACRRAKRVYI